MVQLREKDLPTRELLALALRLRERLDDEVPLLVNGRADVAYAVEMAGVHLPADGLSPEDARAVIGPAALVGRSVHGLEEATALSTSVDYLELGTIFPSRSHPGGSTVGVEAIRRAAAVGAPIWGIGGITADNAESVMAAGACGIAVISAILGTRDPERSAGRLREAVERGWARKAAEEAPSAVRQVRS